MSSRLEARNISRSFGSTEVLHAVSLTVPASGCVALLGASGSGKSTLLRIIAGLDAPSGGQVLVDGEDLALVPVERRGMALVFQKALLFPHLNVIDNVAFAARMAGSSRKQARAEAMEYLELVHLADYAHRPVGRLSGGQEHRVALARALARNPGILLLDEPLASLDVQLRHTMYELIGDIRAQLAPTIVVVTHDRQEASILADTIAVLDDGRILQHGSVHQVHYQPATRTVNELLGGLNTIPGIVLDGRHHSVLGSLPVQTGAEDGPSDLMVRQEALTLLPTERLMETLPERLGEELTEGRAEGRIDGPDSRTVTSGHATIKGCVSSLTSLGARTLVRVLVTGGSQNIGEVEEPEVMITVDVPGHPALLSGQVITVGLQDQQAWAVPAE
ncbi:ABC transporter ATP-binding protein [Arthrobacter sp. B1805]|uniref:ABC transporter ATP-binding protein n=1 Tax=Arthrobacter sp. B1805 TaxID=2058892 RepID=UPI000CE565CA|nr:ABC transporter ATP-binding protein [Arthrobacter sp. B1805]